ncbi:MAG: hypothetical protein AAFX55_20110 [Bacteroidota bacterium]
MRKIIYLLVTLSFFGCSKIEIDDTNNICNSDCTTLQGRFITLNNVGIQGVKVSLRYKIAGGPLGGGFTRLIVETETDENGNFYEQFYVKDDELGETVQGYFLIEYDDSNLDVANFILSDNQIGSTTQPLAQGIASINSRDTIIGNTYYLPKKTNIIVNLNNFVPIQDDDYFEVRTLYPFGPNIGYNDFLDSEYSTGFSGYGTFSASEINSQFSPFVAENEENVIRIARRKNGVNTIEDFPIFIPSNNSIELNYNY